MNRQPDNARQYCYWMVTLLVLMFGPAPISSQATAQTPVQKKLVITGHDTPTAAQLARDVAAMDAFPFDGTVFQCRASNPGPDVNGCPLREAHANKPWKREWFETCVEQLKSVQSDVMTDNFVQLNANPGDVDWFDDEGWANVVDHWRIAAWIAKQGNQKGICFDAEPYAKPFAQFRYNGQPNRDKYSFDQYCDKARQRGREVMQAVREEYPEITVLTYFMNSYTALSSPWQGAPASGLPCPRNALATHNYGLYPAFIDGWLDSAGPEMTFVDGCEMSYYFTSEEEFHRAAVKMKIDALDLVAPENRRKYQAQVQVGFAIYVDVYNDWPDHRFAILDPSEPYTELLRKNVQWALRNTEQYVWVYGERGRWWPDPGELKPWKSRSVFPVWEEVMPGAGKAFADGKFPHKYRTRVMRERLEHARRHRELKNLARNGNFGEPIGGEWYSWQKDYSEGKIDGFLRGDMSWDEEIGHTDPGSARQSQVDHGVYLQQIAVKPGKRYHVSAHWMKQGRGEPMLSIGWKTPNGDWIKWQQRQPYMDIVLVMGSPVVEGQWQEHLAQVVVPGEAGFLCLQLGVSGQSTSEDVIWYDDVEVYQLD